MNIKLEKILEKSNSLSDISRELFGNNVYSNREKCKKILKENNIDWKKWLYEKNQKPKKYCLYCGNEITKYGKKFCNHSCAASYNNKDVVRNGSEREDKYCLNCGNLLNSKKKKYCSYDCMKEYSYKIKIEQWKNGKLKGCDKNGNISHFLRKYILEKKEYKCENCGFDKPNPYTNLSVLQIHHIDGNCTNNKEENLQVLCPTCHSMTKNFGSRNQKSYRTYRYKK